MKEPNTNKISGPGLIVAGEQGQRPGSYTTHRGQAPIPNALDAITPDILEEIRRTLVEQESAYQGKPSERPFSSIWAHSSRVARIAHHIARSEGWNPVPALLAGLLHDCGKFAHGTYHENDKPEEEHAVRIARKILMGTAYEKWLPAIADAILSTFLEGEATNDVGRAVYDADCLDKLGNMGVVQFFVKKALRQRFLSNELLIRAGLFLRPAAGRRFRHPGFVEMQVRRHDLSMPGLRLCQRIFLLSPQREGPAPQTIVRRH